MTTRVENYTIRKSASHDFQNLKFTKTWLFKTSFFLNIFEVASENNQQFASVV